MIIFFLILDHIYFIEPNSWTEDPLEINKFDYLKADPRKQ